MPDLMRRCLVRAAVGMLCVAGGYAGDTIPVAAEGCDTHDPAFYEGKYKLAEDIEFRGGMSFLRSIRQIADPGSDPKLKKGAVLDLQALTDFMNRLQGKLGASSEQRVHFSFVQVYLDRCDPPGGAKQELHVSVRVFDSSPPLPSFRQYESRQLESTDPAGAARSGSPGGAVKFSPHAGFNASDRASGGGLLSARFARGPIQSLTAEGSGSSTGSRASLDLSGERSWESGFLQSASWRLGFLRSDRPSGEVNLVGSSLYGQAQVTSQPLGESNTVLRFASEIGGGNAQSGLRQSDLPANTLASAGNQVWKSAAGISTRVGVHSIAASYGIQLGRVGRGNAIDYHKHLVDVAYSSYKVFGDHKLVEYETRFSAGALKTPGLVPAAERFFGGNRETGFFSGPEFSNDWRIRSNPFLRGIPANEMNRIVPGAVTGGEGFIAWNNTLTLPLPLVNYPLLPKELVESKEFDELLRQQRSASASALVVAYRKSDAAFKQAETKLPEVKTELDAVRSIVNEIATSGGAGQAEAKACLIVIRDRKATLEEAAEAIDIVVEEDDAAVIAPVVECGGKVQGLHPDARFEPALAALKKSRQEIQALLDKIDQPKVDKLVKRDMSQANRIMDVFFKEASIVTVRPIVVFDAARLSGPAASGDPLGVRYSIGGGLRLQFLRVLNLSGGYAANPRRRPGEGAGAIFFSMDFMDLFR